MAIRSCLPDLPFDRRYDRELFEHITTLTNELNLSGEDLNDVRSDARKVVASIRESLRGR